ncbi:hypothetical protein CTI14_59310, partial [Methylobacterium radiotolerans]
MAAPAVRRRRPTSPPWSCSPANRRRWIEAAGEPGLRPDRGAHILPADDSLIRFAMTERPAVIAVVGPGSGG